MVAGQNGAGRTRRSGHGLRSSTGVRPWRATTAHRSRLLARHAVFDEKVGEQEIALRYREQVMVTIDPCLRLPDERDQKAVTALAVPQALLRG